MTKIHQKILIATAALDPHADAVIDELSKLGWGVLRLNTENLLSAYSFQFSHWPKKTLRGEIADANGRIISIEEIHSAYYRKPEKVNALPELSNPSLAEFSIEEGEEFLRTLYGLSEIKWVNDPHAIRRAQRKLPQMRLAAKHGLKTPRTLITNNPKTARRFSAECDYQVVCKALGSPVVESDEGSRFIYTHKLTRSELDSNLDLVRFAPTMLQEWIPKRTEVRATVIGTDVFACEIASQEVPEAAIDWRAVDPDQIPHRSIELPSSVSAALVGLVADCGLRFGAIDLILTPANEYVFLENNPNGQWYWIEMLTGMPMAAAMAKLLTSPQPNSAGSG